MVESIGKAYSDKCKLLSPMLKHNRFRARYFLGDAYYGKAEILMKVYMELDKIYK